MPTSPGVCLLIRNGARRGTAQHWRQGSGRKAESAARMVAFPSRFGQAAHTRPLTPTLFVPARLRGPGVSFPGACFVRRLDDTIDLAMRRVGCSVSGGSSADGNVSELLGDD